MTGLDASCHTRAGISPRIEDVLAIVMLCVVEQSLNPRLREAPRACIQWLFLSPHNVLGVGILVEIFLKLSPREGV